MRAQNYTEMAGEEYVEILDELQEKHQPFNETSSSWVGCLGSDPKYRGYPCSLWQTFHTITVGALLADEFDMNEGVSKTIYDYVHHFFTCRHCAEHFAQEVARSSSSSYNTTTLPMWPSDTVFWMWRLHNMANLRLKGIKSLIENVSYALRFNYNNIMGIFLLSFILLKLSTQ